MSMRADAISVRFGAVRALEGVSLDVSPGEVHSLCGENGAGKSTLIRCLGGALKPDSGSVSIGGRPMPPGVLGAEKSGVAVIHQEPIAFPHLSAEDTIFIGREPARLGGLWLDRSAMRRHARELLASLGEDIDTRRPVGELSLAQRQMVAIARALAIRCRFLILDEPTASLSGREAGVLHGLVRRMAADGVGVLLVSHRLDEILALSHRVSVLRDGRLVATEPAGDLSRAALIRVMVGRNVEAAARRVWAPTEVRLEVRNLSGADAFHDVSLTVHAGEILGLAGLVGAGRSDVARAIAGVDTPGAGEVRVDGRRLRRGAVGDAVDAGVVLVPEDRREQGLVTPMSVGANIGLSRPPSVRRPGFIARTAERALATDSVRRFAIKAPSIDAPVASLSGGNQQKVLLAKWLAHRPRVLILDEPTRGVDVGAKAEIHAMIRDRATQGAAVLLISSDLPELLALSDRVAVLCQGRIAGECSAAAATPEAVLALAMPADPPHEGAA